MTRWAVEFLDNFNLTTQLRSAIGRQWTRSRHLALFWFAVWPLMTVLAGVIALWESPTTFGVPFWIGFSGVAAGLLYLLPEFLVSAFMLLVASAAIFSFFPVGGNGMPKRCWILDAAISFIGLGLGIALEFPSILTNIIFMPVRMYSLWKGYIILALLLILLALLRHGLRQRTLHLGTAFLPEIMFVAIGWMLVQLPVAGLGRPVNQNSTVLLGIDSLGIDMGIDRLREFARERGGAYYEYAVTPGLLTNSVWTAIMAHRPVGETGVLLTFQTPDWSRSPFQLVDEAKKCGFQTWSFFTGQNTVYVGSLGRFDHDRSGPMGWLQDATSAAKNGSVFLSFLVSRLPQLPFSRIPANQAGTYAYDLRAVVLSILTSHEGSSPVCAISHIGYLHDQAYPRFADLAKKEARELLKTQVNSIRDFGGDWQLPDVPGDRINLRDWKIRKVQDIIASEISNSGFLDPRNHNRLIILSDHGSRWKLNNENFGSETYYRVPLITFGIPERDVKKPISLLDIPSLAGFDDPTLPGSLEPLVEYVNILTFDEFKSAILEAEWTADGRINLRPDVIRKYLALLRSYRPTGMGGMIPTTTEEKNSP